MSCASMTTLPFLLLELSLFVLFEILLCPFCNSNNLPDILMVLGRDVEQD